MVDDYEELLQQLEETEPGLLLLDDNMDEIGVAALTHILRLDPNLKILILGQQFESREAYLEAGAAAYLTQDNSPKNLLTVIEEVRLQEKNV